MITIYGVDVKLKHIATIIPKENLVLIKRLDPEYRNIRNIVKDKVNYLSLTIHIKENALLSKIRYSLVEKVKTNLDPEERVLRFEWWPDFNERDRLVEIRKTATEKDELIEELTKDIETCKILDLDYRPLYKELKNKLTGTFGGTL